MPTTGGVRSTTALAEELARLPLQPSAAMRVLWALDDIETSAGDLARLIEVDPALSTRIMQLANSPYYGMARQVSSAAQAVMVVGFTMVRALAVGAASGLFVDRRRGVPDGFWQHASTTAVAAAMVAERNDASVSDAFTAGLLHDLGTALLFRHVGSDWETLLEEADTTGRPLASIEQEALGVTHAWAGAAVLEACRFPPGFVRAVGGHHDEPGAADPLGLAVMAGEALALRLESAPGHRDARPAELALRDAGLSPDLADPLADRMRLELDELACLLAW